MSRAVPRNQGAIARDNANLRQLQGQPLALRPRDQENQMTVTQQCENPICLNEAQAKHTYTLETSRLADQTTTMYIHELPSKTLQ